MAKRDKLTDRQRRQIAKTQKDKTSGKKSNIEIGDLGEQNEGVMVSRFGEQAGVLEVKSGNTYRCFLRQNLGAPVPGDRVIFRLEIGRASCRGRGFRAVLRA